MANVTDPLISQLHGSDPQNCIEYITRQKIYDSRYWKEYCFGNSVLDVLEKSTGSTTTGNRTGANKKHLQCVGGLPCHFLALLLKLLQLHPEHAIIQKAFIEQTTFKYTRVLGCLYVRLTSRPVDIYTSFEPLLNDYRKIRVWTGPIQRRWEITTVDQFVYELLSHTSMSSSSSASFLSSTKVSVLSSLGITIPRLPARLILQDGGYLVDGPRFSSDIAFHTTLRQYIQQQQAKSDDPIPIDDARITGEMYGMAALQYLNDKVSSKSTATSSTDLSKDRASLIYTKGRREMYQKLFEKSSILASKNKIIEQMQRINPDSTTTTSTELDNPVMKTDSIITAHPKTHSTTIATGKRLRTNSDLYASNYDMHDDNATNDNQKAAGDNENNRINPFHDNDDEYDQYHHRPQDTNVSSTTTTSFEEKDKGYSNTTTTKKNKRKKYGTLFK